MLYYRNALTGQLRSGTVSSGTVRLRKKELALLRKGDVM